MILITKIFSHGFTRIITDKESELDPWLRNLHGLSCVLEAYEREPLYTARLRMVRRMISRLLDRLEEDSKLHIEEAEALLKADKGNMYSFDFLAIAVLNRSMSLTSGFIALMRLDNYISAVPLIRLQLDNYLRFAASWLVSNPHDFAVKILSGIQVRELKTKDGRRMTDQFLVDEFSKNHEWIERVYENTSGYIHLSEKHFFANTVEFNPEERTEVFKISDKADNVPDEFKIEAIMAFKEITKLILHRVYSWRYMKDNPPAI